MIMSPEPAAAPPNKPKYTVGETLLQIENVSLAFGSVTFNDDGSIAKADKLVLRDVNAEVRNLIRPGLTQGQVVGFLGPSGIGKTQLFRVISGLLKPTVGRVLVNTERIPVKAGMVGVVPQYYPLFKHRRVLSNLIVAGLQAGLSRTQAKDKAMQFLERFRVADKANAWPAELSGGQKQRVCIIRQLMCSEHFLLMDEPFSGLDPIMLEAVIKLINEVAAADELNTIIVVTHDVSAAVSVADTLWLMGRERNGDDKIIPGAKIMEVYNLIEEGLAWHPEIQGMPEFARFVHYISTRFKSL